MPNVQMTSGSTRLWTQARMTYKKLCEYDNQLRRAKADARQKAKMAEKRKKQVDEWRRINAESSKYNSCIFVDNEEWERFRGRLGIVIVDRDRVPVGKYKKVEMDEDDDIYYISRIEGELVKVIWAKEEMEEVNEVEEVEEKEEKSEENHEIIVIDDDDDDDDRWPRIEL